MPSNMVPALRGWEMSKYQVRISLEHSVYLLRDKYDPLQPFLNRVIASLFPPQNPCVWRSSVEVLRDRMQL